MTDKTDTAQAVNVAALLNEVGELPNPERSLLTHNERVLILLCRKLGDALDQRVQSTDAIEKLIAASERAELATLRRTNAALVEALNQLQSFVVVMAGVGREARIPETIPTPLGVPIKIGEIMRDVDTTLRLAGEV